MNIEHPNFYSIIPAHVRYDSRLNDSDKILYSEITALTQKNGQCWASNQYFASLYNVSKDTISRRISKLAKLGYITVQIIYKENSKEIDKRVIQVEILLHDPIGKIADTYPQSCGEGTRKSEDTPIRKIVVDNNTSNEYYKINNNPYSPHEVFEMFWKLYPKRQDKKKAKTKLIQIIQKKPELAQTIISDLERRVNCQDWKKADGKYIPLPTTYLNGERWEDEIKDFKNCDKSMSSKKFHAFEIKQPTYTNDCKTEINVDQVKRNIRNLIHQKNTNSQKEKEKECDII